MRAVNIAPQPSANDRLGTLRAIRRALCRATIFILLLVTAISPLAQEQPERVAKPSSEQKSEIIAPGVEHLQIVRGVKSDKEATGPWFINILRIDLAQARLQMVHALDEAVGLETVSSMATRYGALAAINSGFFRTTGTYRGDSVGVDVLNGRILSESNNAHAAVGLIETNGAQ